MEALAPELFHTNYIKSGKRIDGRNHNDKRNINITTDCFSQSQSSSMVSCGHTIIATKIIATPQPIAPTITVNIFRAAVSLESGKGSLDQTLSAFTQILVNRFLPLSELEIARPDPHNPFHSNVKLWGWKLDINQSILSDDGGIEMASILGIQQALKVMKLQNYVLNDEAKLVETGEYHTVKIMQLFATSFAKIEDGNIILTDPTSDEEKISDGACTVVVTADGSILGINTRGRFALDEESLRNIVAATCPSA